MVAKSPTTPTQEQARPSQRLPKAARLRKRAWISTLFAHGTRHRLGCLQLCYIAAPTTATKAHQALFVVPKRLVRHAVTRHRLCRRMREAYRLHKHLLPTPATDAPPHLLAYRYTHRGTEATYQAIEAAVLTSIRHLTPAIAQPQGATP